MKAGHVLMLVAASALAGCQTMSSDAPLLASSGLAATKGNKTIGEVTFEQVGGKVRVTAQLINLKPNQEHGFHIHEKGDCSSGDGMGAGGHFNPYGKPHGKGAERHAGDLPNLKADAKGRAKLTVDMDIITLTSGPASIIGRGVIVHADPDDYTSQPVGNAGARLACGVIKLN
ncbi:MAG TPA: superoxide dismutase family protein [Burkholderiales bacterium]|nr:superoxide dismutase family protein [Burkholderiales bacterium]